MVNTTNDPGDETISEEEMNAQVDTEYEHAPGEQAEETEQPDEQTGQGDDETWART